MTEPMPQHDERRYQRRADRLRCARQDARQQRAMDEMVAQARGRRADGGEAGR